MDFTNLLMGAGMVFLATCTGAAGVLVFKRIDCRVYSAIIAFCAGVMVFSALEMVIQSYSSAGQAATFASLIAGMLAFLAVEKLLPHAHIMLKKKEITNSKKKVALIAGTITLHNVPEGFAIASAFASSSPLGWLVTTSMALQDIPEGAVVSVPIACYGATTRRSFLLGVFSGAVEAAAAVFGFVFLSAVTALIPFALAFSGGAMAYVAFFELLPDAAKGAPARSVALWSIAGIAAAFCMATLFRV